MRYLIDTHIFIWGMENSNRLSPAIKTILKDSEEDIFLSLASVWEIVLKKAKGLKTPKDIPGGIQASGFSLLPIKLSHILGIEKLPFHHKDPFDRLLISQAKAEKLTLITSDPKIWKYGGKLIKA